MKEKWYESLRVKMAIAGIILEFLLLLLPQLGMEVDVELLSDLSMMIAGIVIAIIASRTYRNTSL